MLVVRLLKQDGAYAGTSLSPLQPMEWPAEDALNRSGKSDGMESRQMPTRESLWAALHRAMQPSSDGFPGSHWCREVPAQHRRRSKSGQATGRGVRAGWERAEEKGPAGSPRFHPFSFVLYICHSWMLAFVKNGTTGSRSGSPPSRRPARRRRGLRGCHTLSRVNTVWLKQNSRRNCTLINGTSMD